MIIRRYKPDDLSQILKLFHDTVVNINKKDYSEEQIKVWSSLAEDKVRFGERLEECITFVADYKGKVIGVGSFEKNGNIDMLYSHKDYQRKGVASLLLLNIQLEAVEQKIPRLFASVSITAKPFFEKMEFKTVRKQSVERKNVKFTNYLMEKNI